MNNSLQKLNSCKLYRYVTYLYNNHILIRHYLRYKVLLVYVYNQETSALDDLLFFRVLESRVLQFEAEIHRSFKRLQNQVLNLGFTFMRLFVYPPLTSYDHHGIIDQNLTLEDGFHKLFYHRNFRRIHPWIKNFKTGEEKFYFQAAEVIEKICTPSPISFLPVKEGFENRRVLYCRRDDVKREDHTYALPIYSTKLCEIPNCVCYNIGWSASCDVCGYFMHTCPYTPCKYIYSSRRKPPGKCTTLETHIKKYHQNNPKCQLLLIPLEITELEVDEEGKEVEQSIINLCSRDVKEYALGKLKQDFDVFTPYRF